MTISRGTLGRAAAFVAVLPLAGGVLVAAAPAAGAAVTAPGNGAVFTGYSSIQIRASYPRSSSPHRLTLAAPGGGAVTVATADANLDGGTMTYSVDTGCWTRVGGGCRPAPNGEWTVTQSGGENHSISFFTRVRPKAPEGVNATAVSSREVRISWRAGDEPDLTGWAVMEGGETVASAGRGACSSGTCSTVVSYATEGSGDHTYAVKAFRSVSPGSSGTLESPLSSSASARLDAPPPPPPPAEEPSSGGEPSSEPSAGGESGSGSEGGTGSEGGSTEGSTGGGSEGTGGTGGSGSGSGSGSPGSGSGSGEGGGAPAGDPASGSDGTAAPAGSGSTFTADQRAVAQRKAFALGFSAFGPKLGIPKLPPLPQLQAPAIAPELADGSFEPTLGFEDQVLTEQVPVAQGPTQRVRNVVGSALDSERLIRSTAFALVLLLAAAHLRRWLGASAEEH